MTALAHIFSMNFFLFFFHFLIGVDLGTKYFGNVFFDQGAKIIGSIISKGQRLIHD